MSEKKLYIVPHTHWDREWYMSFAKHRYQFVKFMDRLIETLEKDSSFTCFHLDGQIILVSDYLSVRPENEARIRKLILDGRIKIGPFYILQDEYLISGESNIRNVLYGIKECTKYGKYEKVGYFPDAFGNISQMPQILLGFDLDTAAFGRGIVPIGYANEVLGKTGEGYSELNWVAPDGSSVVAVQFINWYNNANEIPSDKVEANKRIKQIIESMSYVAKTDSLLGMNGCDHQPVQTNLPQILSEIATDLGCEIVISSLGEYMEAIKPYKSKFFNYNGEINGKGGTGYFTLVNTASSRVYLKQLNHLAQNKLVNILEPLSVIASKFGVNYDSDIINFAWKKLMENHPHDSICGCSIDEVAREMVVRFTDCIDTTSSLIADEGQRLAKDIATSCEKNIVIFNNDIRDKKEVVRVKIDYESNAPQNLTLKLGNKIVDSEIVKRYDRKIFVLPEDKFREVKEINTIEVEFVADINALSYATYEVTSIDDKVNSQKQVNVTSSGMENKFVEVSFNADGSFDLFDKEYGERYYNQNYFEDTSDYGNEYTYLGGHEKRTTNGLIAKISLEEATNNSVTYKVSNEITLQGSIDKSKKIRSGEECKLTIISYVTLSSESRIVAIKTHIVNNADNHRLRAIFPSPLKTQNCWADGQFDLIKRDIKMSDKWKNPDNCQRMSSFVSLIDGEKCQLVATKGLYEYEILQDNSVAITLLRCIDELGDWYDFPTPEAQCKFENVVSYAVGVSESEANKLSLMNCGYDFSITKLEITVTGRHGGALKMEDKYARIDVFGDIQLSALKRSEDGNYDILRIYNPSCEDAYFTISEINRLYLAKMNEEIVEELLAINGEYKVKVNHKKIVTLAIERCL